jgi:drug/metabolite transporter (DMT)-like permease
MIRWYNFLLVMIATMIGAVGALYLKRGAKELKGTLIEKVMTWKLWLGLFMYGIATIVSFTALRTENVSIIYALTSMSYIWVIIISQRFLGEKINTFKWAAIFLIVLGVILLTI